MVVTCIAIVDVIVVGYRCILNNAGRVKIKSEGEKKQNEKCYCFTWKMKWDGEQADVMEIGCHRWCEHQRWSNGLSSSIVSWEGGQWVQQQRTDNRWVCVWVLLQTRRTEVCVLRTYWDSTEKMTLNKCSLNGEKSAAISWPGWKGGAFLHILEGWKVLMLLGRSTVHKRVSVAEKYKTKVYSVFQQN